MTKFASVLDALRDRFVRQAKNMYPDGDGDLAALARSILAERIGNDTILSSSYGRETPSADQTEAAAGEAVALNSAIGTKKDGKIVGRSGSAPKTFGVLWEAMVRGWCGAIAKASTTKLAEALIAPLASQFDEPEQDEISQVLMRGFKQVPCDKLLDLLALGKKDANETVVRRGMHTLAQKLTVERLVFATACLNAVTPPGPYPNRTSNRFWLIKDAAAAIIKHLDELAAAVEDLNFSDVNSHASEPPHRRLKMSSPQQFEYCWHTSSDPSVYGKNRQYYGLWLDDAVMFVERLIKKETRAGFTIRLAVHFVEHKPLWGVGAEKDEFPPIIDTLEKVIS